jgi:hypothetical protein
MDREGKVKKYDIQEEMNALKRSSHIRMPTKSILLYKGNEGKI